MNSGSSKLFPIFIIACLIAIYTTVYSYAEIHFYNMFYESAFDIGLYNQALWLISHFHFKAYSTFRFIPFALDHFAFIIYPLSIFYLIFPSPVFLIILQSLALSSGVIPLYLLTKRNVQHKHIPFIIAVCYLLYPALGYLTLYNFHPESLAVPALLWMFLLEEEKKHNGIFYTLMVIVLLTKELAGIVIAMYGLTLLIKRRYKTGMYLILIGIGWFLFAVFLTNTINTKLGGIYFNDLSKYSYLGNSISKIILFLITHPFFSLGVFISNYLYLWQLFGPTMFISFFGIIEIIPAVGVIWINLLSNYKPAHTIFFQYTAFIIPFIWYGTIKGISFFSDNATTHGKSTPLLFKVIIPILLLLFSFGMFYRWMLPGIKYKLLIHNKLSNVISNAIKYIPDKKVVLGTTLVVSHLSQREYVYDIDTISVNELNKKGPAIMLKQIPANEPIYIILIPEMAHMFSQEAGATEDNLLQILQTNNISPIYNKDGVFVFKISRGSTFIEMIKHQFDIF